VPSNIEEPLSIDTDFSDMNDDEFANFMKYANFTCKFTIGDETIITKGYMTTDDGTVVDPDSKTRPTRIAFYSPKGFHN
jgi:hypothetical protein